MTTLSHAQLAASIKQELIGTAPEAPAPTTATTHDQQHHHPAPTEPVNLVDLEERILQLCAESPKGITEDVIKCDQPLVDTARRMKALQRLLSQGKLDVLRSSSKQGSASILLYRLKSNSSASSITKGFEREERLVYQIIEDSGNKGIWTRDIRIKSNLSQTDVSKILKKLESKQLIKPVKSVQASKKRVYMLFDLTPDETLTGGAWYSDQEFESEFVEVLNQHCLKFLQQKAFKARASHSDPISQASASLCSTKEVCKYITELGISKVKLTVDDIRMILDTLIYDGKAEVQIMLSQQDRGGEGSDLQRLYRVTRAVLQDTGFSRIPCGVCPVINQCCDGGAVSPATCVYMKEWLTF